MKFIPILFLLLIACKENKLDPKELDTALSENKHNFVFKSFYPDMPTKLKDALIERELKNGSFKQIPNDYGSNDIVYTLEYDNSKIDFVIASYKSDCFSMFTSEENLDYMFYQRDLERIVEIYKNKYVEVSNNEGELPRYVNDSIVLQDQKKVIVVIGKYSGKGPFSVKKSNGTIVETSYSISVDHYTKDSFKKMLDKYKSSARMQEENLKLKLQKEKANRSAKNSSTLEDI